MLNPKHPHRLILKTVFIALGEECWTPNFPHPGQFFGRGTKQSPMRIMQCANKCDAWNYADSKMDDLTAFLLTGGPTYLMAAKDKDNSVGNQYIDTKVVAQGHDVFARECASCHSSKVAPENIRADKNALAKFYEGHVFGKEDYWRHEFSAAKLKDFTFMGKYFAKDANVLSSLLIKAFLVKIG